MTGMSGDEEITIQMVAEEAFAVLNTGLQIAPFSSRIPDFDLEDAYRVTAAVRQMREARGETPLGRKIGFTNRTIWDEYQINAPMWGYIYDQTVHMLGRTEETVSLAGLAEPRIEPEIVFHFAAAPTPGMDERALLQCVDWVAHGFELVQSIFPRWDFTLPDTVAAYGLHGMLMIGPRHSIAANVEDWAGSLSEFRIDLKLDGGVVDQGRAANVLGGPLSALKHLVEVLARDPVNPPLKAGEIVTTGTLTRAFPVAPGESWTTTLTDIPLEGMTVRFT
jgi:2-oxo-3-hexenedioate decarboxylase